jgi:thymidylate synthase
LQIYIYQIESIINDTYNKNVKFKTYYNNYDSMSQEYIYLNCLKKILKYGEQIIDRTKTGTLSLFGENLKFSINTINISNDSTQINFNKLMYQVPIITTKKIYLQGVIWELIWFLRGDTNVKWLQDRDVKIWNSHSSKEFLESLDLDYDEGLIGPGYGHQWVNWGGAWGNNCNNKGVNQIKYIINELKTNPASRRAVLSAWNVSDLDKMALPPCHMMYIFKVSNHNDNLKKLNCKVILRSNDMFLGCPFNIASASILTILISRSLSMIPGEIELCISDAHVYLNHLEQVKEQIARPPYTFPTMIIDKNINSWENMCDLKYDDFKFLNYTSHPKIVAKMAI